MEIKAIQQAQPKRSNAALSLATATGAGLGAVSRYVVPTKKELGSFVNKDAVDTFVSNTACATRGANRSILKYSGIGALAGAGLVLLSKLFPKKEEYNTEYSKLGALIDAPDYACEIMWYGDAE